jgi:hypothetical protein
MQATQTNREILETLFQGETFLTPEQEYEYRSEDFTGEIPQTGERIDSREALRDMQKGMGRPPAVSLQRLTGEGDFWAVEAIQTYEQEGDYHVCVLVEFDNGKIKRETRYYGPPLQTNR